MKLICPSCGTRYDSGKFCPECGSPLSEVETKKVMFCPTCQAETPSGKFCPECGTKLEEREIEIGADSTVKAPFVEASISVAETAHDPEIEVILSKYRDSYGDMRELNKEEYAIAAEELDFCVKQGNPEGMCFLAGLYMEGLGVEQDINQAYNLVCEAEKKGSKYASAILGLFYAHGIIVDVNYDEAIKRLVEGYNNTGIPGFAGFTALVYLEINDYCNALKYAQFASEKEDKEGLNVLGALYLNGWGVKRDEKKSFEYYLQAASLGHEIALNQIGWMYQTGCGVDEDPDQAFFWYSESAQKGCDVGMNNLACCYRDGKGIEQDYEVAAEWFKKAAEAGWVDSMLELGNYYHDILVDMEKAKYWLLKAAERGNAMAMNRLGVIYAYDINPDYIEAIKWYNEAIKQDQPNAYRNLALCYLEGNGVEKNLKKAEELISKAAELGIEDANEIIAEIRKCQEPSAEIFKIWYDCDGHNQINVHSHLVVHGLKGKKGYIGFEITGRKNKKYELGEIVNFDYDDTEWKDCVFYIMNADSDLNLKHGETIDCKITISVSYYTEGYSTKLLTCSSVRASVWHYYNVFSPSKISIK